MVWWIYFGIVSILSMETIEFAGTIVLVQEVYGEIMLILRIGIGFMS